MKKELQLSNVLRNPDKVMGEFFRRPETFWTKKGEINALRLFREMASRVPAYKDFLKKNKIQSNKVTKIEDFKNIPSIDKQSYLRAYPIEQLCWDGEFDQKRWVISTTSGSTGESFYFPRTELQEWQYAAVAEMYLRTNFDIQNNTTLYIDAFPMGPWIGGLFTYEALRKVAARGDYSLSIITTSIDKNEILKAVRKFGRKFDQVIIGCYGPFLKDVIDDGIAQGIDWKKYNIKFIFSAEAFSERFRDYIVHKTGLKSVYKDTLNHYGTVDLGTMAYETPISILIRRLAVNNKQLYETIFPNAHFKLPTLTQYIPELFYFEESEGDLFCSAFSGIPLVKYDLKDHGGVVSFESMKDKLKIHGIDIEQEVRKAKLQSTVWKLPFVYVYERSDLSISFYAFQVYPETIKRALQLRTFENKISSKFTMFTSFDDHHNQYIEINVELKRGEKSTAALTKAISKSVTDRLLIENSEYCKTYAEIKERAVPKIIFWNYEDPLYFKPGIKQKWVQKK